MVAPPCERRRVKALSSSREVAPVVRAPVTDSGNPANLGAQADLELRRLDVIDTRATADFMVAPMMILLSSSDRDKILSAALLITELAGHAIRLAIALEPPLTDRIVAQFKTMVIAVLEANRELN